MNRLKSNLQNQGQALIESLFILPLFLTLLFFAIQISFVTISKRIVTWACFSLARELLPISPQHPSQTPPQAPLAYASTYRILSKIPFQKIPPIIQIQDLTAEVSVSISQPIFLWTHPYEITNKITLYR